jgi:predicted N-acetyltransferase YhbS
MSTKYRKFARKDAAAAHRLSLEVGWPHRLEDWRFVQSLGAGHVAAEGDGIVGTVLTWKHDRHNASLGMVIVTPRCQGRGIGGKLMELALGDLAGHSVMLNATAAGQPLYEKLGFREVDSIQQHQGTVARLPVTSLARGERLRPVGASDGPGLVALATRATGVSRGRVIPRLLAQGEGIVLARGEEMLGFALFRRFGHGYAIGPVVAPDAARARVLVSHWVAMNPGQFLRIDVHGSSGLGGWLDGIGLEKVDTVVTMVKGTPPARDPGMRSFAIVSQALG